MNEKKIVQDVIELLGAVTDLFYQDKVKDGYKKLEELLAALSVMLEELYKEGVIESSDVTMLDILKEVMGAMEQQDSLLVADILEYDLKEALQQL